MTDKLTYGESMGGMGQVVTLKRDGVVVDTWPMHIDPYPSTAMAHALVNENRRFRAAAEQALLAIGHALSGGRQTPCRDGLKVSGRQSTLSKRPWAFR